VSLMQAMTWFAREALLRGHGELVGAAWVAGPRIDEVEGRPGAVRKRKVW
jgi:hypothetical protein